MELEKLELILESGNQYTGWGYYDSKDIFVPHGCGKKHYNGYYEYGNFKHGILDGPAIISYGNRMVTQQFTNGEGTGWGLSMANRGLSNFGYYKDGELLYNYTDFIFWYFNKMLKLSNGANLLNMYSSKETHQVSVLWIGFDGGFLSPCKMGVKFMPDGSVWVGDSKKLIPTGLLMHFCPNGQIDVGTFENGELHKRLSMDNFTRLQLDKYELDLVSIPEIEPGHNYFEEDYSGIAYESNKNLTFMRYHVGEIDFNANGKFQKIEDECWEIGNKYIKTNHGNLDVLDATVINNEHFVGVQFEVCGRLSLDDFSCSKGNELEARIRTIAFLRHPKNAWVWVYAFDNEGRPLVNFSGFDDFDGMANFIQQLSGFYNLNKDV